MISTRKQGSPHDRTKKDVGVNRDLVDLPPERRRSHRRVPADVARRGSHRSSLGPGERFVDRFTLLREELRPGLSYVKAVFQPNSKLAVNHHCWFITKTHSRLHGCLVSTHKVRPLVSVKTDTVTRAMRQAGHFIIRTKPGIGDHFARGRVNDLARGADLDRSESRILGLAFEIPDLSLSIGGLAENKSARDV